MSSVKIILWWLAWLVSVAGAFLAGAYAHKYRATIRAMVQTAQHGEIIETSLYVLRKSKIAVPAEGRDGGIAPLETGVLLVSRKGKAWFLDDERNLNSLALQVPVNVQEFENDPYNKETVGRERFGVKDIAVQTGPYGVRVLASHTHWYPENDCYTLRVSSIEATYGRLFSEENVVSGEWRKVFETMPCRTLNLLKTGKRAVTLGAGGRIAPLSDHEVLVSVGGFGAESESVEPPDDEIVGDHSYGKTVLFNLVSGQQRVFSKGHRNPQGLTVGGDSRIWLTEHGPKGGDELNLVKSGRDYGWPNVTYGTEYEMMVWPGNPHQGRHEGFEKPVYAWITAIGVSQLLAVEKDAFPFWKGDLLVSSLKGMSLFRVRIEEEHARFVEQIPVGHRIRDAIETADGSIVLKTEDNFLVYLDPADNLKRNASNSSVARGKVLSIRCRSCHTFEDGGPSGIGPNLWGTVGRRIASQDGFAYSAGLKNARMKGARGRWSTAELGEFLLAPHEFAPGTSMNMTTSYSKDQVSDLVAFLETLQ